MYSEKELKNLLLKLNSNVEDFELRFTGKSSKKVDGLYKPNEKLILIHNKNHKTDNELIYTAIHEFAHHVHVTTSGKPVKKQAHTLVFWEIFHKLLNKAEKKGIYENIFDSDDDFEPINEAITERLELQAKIMKELGELFIKAMHLCEEKNVSFEDYTDRFLQINRKDATLVSRISEMNLDNSIGFDNMKIVAREKDPIVRANMHNAFKRGDTQEMVKVDFSEKIQKEKAMSRLEYLKSEKERLEKQVEKDAEEIKEIERLIEEVKEELK